jgi:nicotinate phosphoribosyltransferase
MSVFRLTDRYQLTMLAAYAEHDLAGRRAVFELFVRKLPPSRRYLVACGIGRAMAALSDLVIDDAEVSRLAADPFFRAALDRPKVRALFEGFRFRGRVLAVPEGRVCFPGEPLVRVEGTLAEAQLVETLLLSIVNHDTRIASKCARIVQAADGRPVFEFGSRRTHELAAVDAARSAYVAGFAGTSNEEANARYGVPIAGTMAHSFVLAYAADHGEDGEALAFRAMMETFPARPTFLVDTFDTARGIDRAIEVAGAHLGGVRIDSGDLDALTRDARVRLDAAGLGDARVFLSDDLDEYRIDALVRGGAPVASFGVGTMAVATPDAPTLGGVYKLVAMEDARGRLVAVQKKSPGKGSSAAPKQVFRRPGTLEDVVGLDAEGELGEPVLVPMGDDAGDLAAARARLAADLALAPPSLLSLAPRAEHERHPVTISEKLIAVQTRAATHGRAEL